jgi:hypothetical protein
MSTPVYVVLISGWEWSRIGGVFSTREVAEECLAILQTKMENPKSDYHETTTVIEMKIMQLDPPLESIGNGL